jgi:transcriptional antiterminator RfaH
MKLKACPPVPRFAEGTAAISPSPRCWYAVQTQSFAEERASRHLAAQGFEVFLPCYRKQRRHARRIDYVKAPLFPRYLFVAPGSAGSRMHSVNGTIGVVRLVATGDRPVSVARGVVEELMCRRDADGLIPLGRNSALAPGDAVRVTHSAFAMTLGLMEGFSDADRVTILLDLMGRKVRVVLDEALVEKAA